MNIKSSIKGYSVQFNDNFTQSLNSVYNQGDIIIIDNKVYSSLLKNYKCIKLDISEKSKEFSNISNILHDIIGNFNKTNKLIAIGGGITQDITGFIASIIFRGVNWVFFPTTLLAQGDSCIGGKTSINFNSFKNQLGNFYPPNQVFICNDFLSTLPNNAVNSGLGEMLHFFLVSGVKDYNFFIKNKNNISKLVKRCLQIKKLYVEIDEFDKKERLILNYGHTFGHAIEAVTDNKIEHGVAVSMGMDIANYISYRKKYITLDVFENIQKNLVMIYKNITLPNIDKLIKALEKDKKNISNKLNCVLTKGPGNMFLEEVEYKHIIQYLNEYNAIK